MPSLIGQIRAAGYTGDEQQLLSLARVLLDNDIMSITELACLNRYELDGTSALHELDLAFIDAYNTSAVQLGQPAWLPHPSQAETSPSVPEPPVVAVVRKRLSAANDVVVGMGPKLAMQKLAKTGMSDQEKVEWFTNARAAAIAGSCPRSHKSAISGLKCYVAFAQAFGAGMPPTTSAILAWSQLFRSGGTFSNYVGYVKLACDIMDLPCDHLDQRLIHRAKLAIDKKRHFIPRGQYFLRLDVVSLLLDFGKCVESFKPYVMAFLTSYVFMLRLPSECLPIRTGSVGTCANEQAVIETSDQEVSLRLKRRKNKASGSLLVRRCWCSTCKETCPVHVLGAYVSELGVGVQPFVHITAASALRVLRDLLVKLEVKDAGLYRTHDFRRGHARDMQAWGSTLAEILAAGEWSSPAFMKYLDMMALERDAVMEAHLDESGDEDD
jgi:hypothetical protein